MLTETRQIEEFLNDYKRSRIIIESSVRATLNRALEFEHKFNKPFYEFSTEEVLEMYKSAHAISNRSLQNSNLTLKHAARWMLYNKGMDTNNVYENITKDLIENCIDTEKRDSLILSREDLNNIQNELANMTDIAILELLFLGVGGKFLKELTFLDMSQVSKNDSMIYFKTGKKIHIDNDMYNLIRKACLEDELISFNDTVRISKVKSLGIYKQRFNSLSANADDNSVDDIERRYRWVQRRLYLISKHIGIDLKPGTIQDSGLLHCLKQGVKETGLEFREYVKTEECGNIAKRFDLYTNLYGQIIIEKFEKYFK